MLRTSHGQGSHGQLFGVLTSKSYVARDAFLLPANRDRLLRRRISHTPPALISRDPREITPEVDLEDVSIILSLRPEDDPRDLTTGFVFGNAVNASEVDVIIATHNNYGVSGKHFVIQLDRCQGALILTNTSRYGTRLTSTARRPQLLRLRGESTILSSGDTIFAGFAELQLWICFRPEQLEMEFERVQRTLSIRAGSEVAASFTDEQSVTRFDGDIISLQLPIIGKGGFGKIFRAVNSRDEPFAVKIFNSERMRHAVQEQTELLASFQHEHIIKVFPQFRIPEESRESRKPYMVMELAHSSIDAYENWQIGGAERIFSQLFDAVTFLHANHLVHGDIKPQNVLLRSDVFLHIILCDFDTVKWDILLNKFRGSVKYAAPEIAKAQWVGPEETSFYTKKIDVWSLGIMLLDFCLESLPELPMSGENPADSVETWTASIGNLLNSGATAKTGYEHLLDLARVMLVPNPDERPEISICNSMLETAIELRNIPPSPTELATETEGDEFVEEQD